VKNVDEFLDLLQAVRDKLFEERRKQVAVSSNTQP
jgi:hypothetical protein